LPCEHSLWHTRNIDGVLQRGLMALPPHQRPADGRGLPRARDRTPSGPPWSDARDCSTPPGGRSEQDRQCKPRGWSLEPVAYVCRQHTRRRAAVRVYRSTMANMHLALENIGCSGVLTVLRNRLGLYVRNNTYGPQHRGPHQSELTDAECDVSAEASRPLVLPVRYSWRNGRAGKTLMGLRASPVPGGGPPKARNFREHSVSLLTPALFPPLFAPQHYVPGTGWRPGQSRIAHTRQPKRGFTIRVKNTGAP